MLLTTELPAVGLHGRTRTCATRLREPALCPLSYVELVPTAGVEPARRPGFEDRRSVQLSYAGIGVAGGTCTRHLGAGNAAFCSLNYGHMVTAGGVAPPASTVSAWRSAVELRGRVLDWCARGARIPTAWRPSGSRPGASACSATSAGTGCCCCSRSTIRTSPCEGQSLVCYRYTNRDCAGRTVLPVRFGGHPRPPARGGSWMPRTVHCSPPRFERGQTGVKARWAAITQGAILRSAPARPPGRRGRLGA